MAPVRQLDGQPKRRPHGRNLPNAPRRLEAEEKQRRAWDLRVAGASFSQIAIELGYVNEDGSAAHSAAIAAIDEWRRKVRAGSRVSVEAEIELQAARLDRLILDLWTALHQAIPAVNGQTPPNAILTDPLRLGIIDRLVRVLARQAALLGLDAADRRDDARVAAEQLQADLLFRVFDAALTRMGLAEDIRLDGRRVLAGELRLLEGAPLELASGE